MKSLPNQIQNLIYKFISIRQVLNYLKEYDIVDEIPEIVSVKYFWSGHTIGKFYTSNNKIKEISFLHGNITVIFNTSSYECLHFKELYKGFKIMPDYYHITYSHSISQQTFINSKEALLVITGNNLEDVFKQCFAYIKLFKEKSIKIERTPYWGFSSESDRFLAEIKFYEPVLNSSIYFDLNKFIGVK